MKKYNNTSYTLLYNKRNATPRKNRLCLLAGISCPSKAVFYFRVVGITDFAVWSEPIFQVVKPIFTLCGVKGPNSWDFNFLQVKSVYLPHFTCEIQICLTTKINVYLLGYIRLWGNTKVGESQRKLVVAIHNFFHTKSVYLPIKLYEFQTWLTTKKQVPLLEIYFHGVIHKLDTAWLNWS